MSKNNTNENFVVIWWPDNKPGLFFGIVKTIDIKREVLTGIYSNVYITDIKPGVFYTVKFYNKYYNNCRVVTVGSLKDCQEEINELLDYYYKPNDRKRSIKRRRLM